MTITVTAALRTPTAGIPAPRALGHETAYVGVRGRAGRDGTVGAGPLPNHG